MPSPISFTDFKRKFKHYGVSITSAGRGSHYKMEKVIDGLRVVFIVPVHHGKVDFVYVPKAIRRFQIDPADFEKQ